MTDEGKFKSLVRREIKCAYPGCIIIKLPAEYIQGIPDMLILYRNKWAALEFKRSENAEKRPNQSLYIKRMNEMSFATFIYPENKKEVLYALERFFKDLS